MNKGTKEEIKEGKKERREGGKKKGDIWVFIIVFVK